ncbi:MAG TPA: hypothetical protein PLF60_00105 [Bacillota bacterium]|nr:hypothetical protein [Bacillota bacterium]HPT35393.1 hypothetical protein [Bacillota bacterium]
MPLKNKDSQAEQSRPGQTAGRPAYLRGLRPREKPPGEVKEAAPVETHEEQEPKEDVELYRWTNWLLPRRPLVAVFVIASLIGCIVLAYWAVPQPFFVAVITIIFLNRLAPYLFPVTFILTEETVGYRTFLARDIRNWDVFLAYREFPDGVFLTHDIRTFRGRLKEGIFLYYYEDCSNKDEILHIVSTKLKPLDEALSAPQEKKENKGGLRSAFDRIRRLRSKK